MVHFIAASLVMVDFSELPIKMKLYKCIPIIPRKLHGKIVLYIHNKIFKNPQQHMFWGLKSIYSNTVNKIMQAKLLKHNAALA